MHHRILWSVTSTLILAGLGCLVAGAVLVGNALMVLACAAYAGGLMIARNRARQVALAHVPVDDGNAPR